MVPVSASARLAKVMGSPSCNRAFPGPFSHASQSSRLITYYWLIDIMGAFVTNFLTSGILPVFGNRLDGYRNSKRMAINGMVKRLCKEEDVGYVDLWDSFVGKEEMYVRDGLHLSGKGAAVFAEGLSGAVASGLDKVRYLN